MYLKVRLKCNSTSVQLRIGETGFAGSNVVIQTVQLDGAKKEVLITKSFTSDTDEADGYHVMMNSCARKACPFFFC